MILTLEHFLEENPNNYTMFDSLKITSIKCFHATMLPDISAIQENGLLLPTVELLQKKLLDIGITDIPVTTIQEAINTNGKEIYVHMNQVFLEKAGLYHSEGSEKIRKLLFNWYRHYSAKLREYNKKLKGYIIELEIPIAYMHPCIHEELQDGGPLYEHPEDVDVSFLVNQNIPAKYIANITDVTEKALF